MVEERSPSSHPPLSQRLAPGLGDGGYFRNAASALQNGVEELLGAVRGLAIRSGKGGQFFWGLSKDDIATAVFL